MKLYARGHLRSVVVENADDEDGSDDDDNHDDDCVAEVMTCGTKVHRTSRSTCTVRHLSVLICCTAAAATDLIRASKCVFCVFCVLTKDMVAFHRR